MTDELLFQGSCPRMLSTVRARSYIGYVSHVLRLYAAARLLDVSIEEVRRLQPEEAPPVYNLGGERMVLREALFAYAKRNGAVLARYFPLSL